MRGSVERFMAAAWDRTLVGKIPINIYVLAAADGLIGDYQLLHADISGGYLAISPHGKYWYVC